MKFSVIISTFNSRNRLDLVLFGMSRQDRMPEEILVADDGSSDGTDALVASWARDLDCNLKHVWQTDRGIRKGRIVNEAVRRSMGDHLVFLDGDSIPHRSWFCDHAEAARRKAVLCGRRVRLGAQLTDQIDRGFIADGKLESLVGPVFRSFFRGDTKRFFLGVRLPASLSRCIHPRPRRLMGANFSLSREAFFRVNGYDEGWPERREDKDLELRLRRAGYPFYPLLNRAIVYHLYHEERLSTPEIEQRVRAEEASSRIVCEQGLISADIFDPTR